jgi:hypothetical protein
MFRLSDSEVARLRSQIVTSKGRGGRRYVPLAFLTDPAVVRRILEHLPLPPNPGNKGYSLESCRAGWGISLLPVLRYDANYLAREKVVNERNGRLRAPMG